MGMEMTVPAAEGGAWMEAAELRAIADLEATTSYFGERFLVANVSGLCITLHAYCYDAWSAVSLDALLTFSQHHPPTGLVAETSSRVAA